MKGLIHRAHVLCDLKEDLLEELSLLKDVFISNGYPEKLVLKTLAQSWALETLKAVLVGVKQEIKTENEKEYNDVIHAPYVRGFSEHLGRKLRRLKVGYVPKRGETLYTNLCRLKQKVELEDYKNVVYAVECETCGVQYIGETGQHFCDRRNQHQRDIGRRNCQMVFMIICRETRGIYLNL